MCVWVCSTTTLFIGRRQTGSICLVEGGMLDLANGGLRSAVSSKFKRQLPLDIDPLKRLIKECKLPPLFKKNIYSVTSGRVTFIHYPYTSVSSPHQKKKKKKKKLN